MHLNGGDVLLNRPCEEKVVTGPWLTITLASKFRLALLDDMEQGSVGMFMHIYIKESRFVLLFTYLFTYFTHFVFYHLTQWTHSLE